jgi:subtilisin family serine protease
LINKITPALMSAVLVIFVGVASETYAADMKITQMSVDPALIPADGLANNKTNFNDIYVVQLKGDPVIAYEGGIQGYKATKPGKGQKLNPNSAHVKKYAAYLEEQQDAAIQSVGGEKVYSYRYGINGFAARMTEADARALKRRGDVVNVWKDEIQQLQTDTSPTYIGLTEGGEAWSKGLVGEDVVIGIIDSGIWPEHPSFADVATPKKGNKGPLIPYEPPSGFTPSGCDFGNAAANPLDVAASCNNKLVAARCYNSGFSAGPDPSNPCGGDGAFTLPTEFQSARDNDGHGSHVGSTAGGNYGVEASIEGQPLGNVSGVAPRAHIAAYKVCWNGSFPPAGFSGGCATSDSAMAIDQAVVDGVDVINFSIGGASTFFAGFDDIAFLFAADAGVWVATSNGNSGPGAETVGTPAGVPWITAVGANQDDAVFGLAVSVDSPASIAGNKDALEGSGPVRLSDTGPISGDVTLVSDNLACGPIDPISGIALASRGACGFIDKYNNAAAAGADAIIVFNDGASPDRIDPIGMGGLAGATIPGVMVGFYDGIAMAGETGVTATLDPNNLVSRVNRVAGFSSRGPNGGMPDVIKPDISAPGVSILAAQTPIPNDGQLPGQLFQVISGTSMSSPHVAGAFALLKQAHPDWSAAQARSALMTTARQGLKKTFGDDAATPFDIGAGEILPSDAPDPGLSYDAGLVDYVAALCGEPAQAGIADFIFGAGVCEYIESFGFSLDPSDLNLASIGIAELAGSQTVTRTVTSVANNNGNKSFTVSVDAPPGIDVSVNPSTIKLKKGESATYQVTFTATDTAVLDEWVFGSLTWTHGGEYSVRSPIAIRPVAFAAPSEVDGVADGAGNGSVDVPVQFGYTGDYTASVSGLTAGLSAPGNITGPQGNLDIYCFDLPAMSHFRTALFDEDTSSPGADDLDLRLFYAPGGCGVFDIAFVDSSGGATSDEVIDWPNAPAGGYVVVVDYYAAANGSDTDYRVWYQPVFGDAGNTMVTAPAGATVGTSATVTVDYNGLVPTRNLGVLHHEDGVGELARTILDIDAR